MFQNILGDQLELGGKDLPEVVWAVVRVFWEEVKATRLKNQREGLQCRVDRRLQTGVLRKIVRRRRGISSSRGLKDAPIEWHAVCLLVCRVLTETVQYLTSGLPDKSTYTPEPQVSTRLA